MDTVYNARIKQKRDTSSNWTRNNPILLNGEIILVDTEAGELRAKIGDGIKTYTQLPFSDETLRNLITNSGGNISVDDALSPTSTNPVQNKVVNSEISRLNSLVGDTSVSTQIEEALSDKLNMSAGMPAIIATSVDGIEYNATVPGINTLTVGAAFIMIPSVKSSSTTPTLNVNNLGAKGIRRRLSGNALSLQKGTTASWLPQDQPFIVVYDGAFWIVENQNKPMVSDLYGYFTSVLVKDRINHYGYVLEMQNGQLVSSCCAESIRVTTLPTKTEYDVGEEFDKTGMVVTATCEDGSIKIINNDMCDYSPRTMTAGEVEIVITYTERNIQYTDSFTVTVT